MHIERSEDMLHPKLDENGLELFCFKGRPHNYDDDAVCRECGLDGAEASYYAKRGYAHEYPTLHDCPGKQQ